MKEHEFCPKKALKLLGDYETLRIVDALRDQELRFSEVRGALEDVNQVTLCKRLRTMEEAGVLKRQEETIDRQSVTYSLTKMGQGMVPLLDTIKSFAITFGVK